MIRDSTGNFTMDVIAKCAFAIDTNAHCDRTNPFLQNAIKIFEFNIFRLLAGFITPKPLYNFFADIRLPFYYLKSNKFFINLSLHLIQQRKESKDGQYDDMLQLMVNARHGEGDRYEQDDQFDSFHVNLGKDEIEKENELFKDVIGSKYLSEEEIVAQSMIFFLAGYETTATTLAHCFYELAMNQDVQQKLYNEIKSVLDDGKPLNYSNVMTLPYLDAVLSETLRKYPPLVFLNRTASEDYHIQEYDITVKKDRGVIIPVYAIHHDPEYYPDPERYDPERFMPENRHKLVPYTYLPFGGGPRNCIGMRFALTEAKLGIANLIKLFQIVKIAETPHKCAFATDTNAHSDSRNPFVENARKFFDFDLIRTILAFITPKALFDFLYKIHTPCFYSESVEFFKNLGSHLINQRKNYNERKFDDLLQLMIDAKHGNNVRLEKEDQFDSFHVNFGKEELEKENEIFKEIIGSKYLDEEEIIAQSMIFFSAGYETTANTMAMCLYELAINQNVQQKLFDEIQSVLDDGKPLDYSNVMTLPYLDSVLSETLRKHPPATLLMRQASEDYYIKEYDITVEKNNDVMIPVYAIHHDPEYYPDPERYDPERFMPENRHKLVPYTYLPFGGGPRNCIGMRFALTEAKLGIANMIKSFRIVRTAKTSDELRLTRSLFLLKTEPIFIGIEKR
ncbi:hypothetical protein SSS_06904 [Sarcoptes scabiei]|nr:hypothetical protein SSS_06904 [Sarcoptes scabiei]